MPDPIPDPELTAADLTAIKAKLKELDALLPVVPVLSEAERRKLQQVKGRRLAFILRALTGAKDNPGSVPPKLDVATWGTQQADFLGADEIEAELMRRLAVVRLFKAVKGAGTYGTSRKYYRFLRDNLDDYREMEPLLDELGALFEGQGDEGDEDDDGGDDDISPPGGAK